MIHNNHREFRNSIEKKNIEDDEQYPRFFYSNKFTDGN
jgi:hypothetical protein